MSASANRFRWSCLGPFLGSCLAGLVCLLVAGSARAASNPATCINDIDCAATPTCGGDVCDYVTAPIQTCKAAGSQPKGSDGWCTVDSDCKCAALGAKCNIVNCTFTKASDAPSGSAGKGGGSGGGSGSAGTSGSGGSSSAGTGGSSTGGSKGTDGSSTGGTGSSSSGGGCSVAGPISPSWSIAFGAVGLLAVLKRRRARRRG